MTAQLVCFIKSKMLKLIRLFAGTNGRQRLVQKTKQKIDWNVELGIRTYVLPTCLLVHEILPHPCIK